MHLVIWYLGGRVLNAYQITGGYHITVKLSQSILSLGISAAASKHPGRFVTQENRVTEFPSNKVYFITLIGSGLNSSIACLIKPQVYIYYVLELSPNMVKMFTRFGQHIDNFIIYYTG